MRIELAGWSPAGIAATILILAGLVLMTAYVLRRGLHQAELDGTVSELEGVAAAAASPTTASAGSGAASSARTLGILGATLLVAGLALGVVSAVAGWGTNEARGGPGTVSDCAQSWDGCPNATVGP